MAIFIPRWERYKDKKPTGLVELNYGHELSDRIDMCFTLQEGLFINLADNSTYTQPLGGTTTPNGFRFDGVSNVNIGKPIVPSSSISIVCGVVRERLANEGILSDVRVDNWKVSGVSLNLHSDGLLFVLGSKVSRSVGHLNIPGHFVSIAATADVGSVSSLYEDGIKAAIYSVNDVVSGFTQSPYMAVIGSYYDRSQFRSLKGEMHYLYKMHKKLSSEQVASLAENPYQILKPRRKWFVGSINLISSANAASKTNATINASVPIVSASISSSSASAGISAQVLASVISGSVSSGNGNISANVSLSASAIIKSAASAGISFNALMQAHAIANATASSSLSSDAGNTQLDAIGVSKSKTDTLLFINATLSGTAVSKAVSNVSITTGEGLSAAAKSSASGTGILLVDVPVSGHATSYVNVVGGLSVIVPISSSTASVSNATGGLNISVGLSALALAKSLIQAGLSISQNGQLLATAQGGTSTDAVINLSVPLSVNALSTATAIAALSEGFVNIPQIDRWTVVAKNRRYKVCA